jgi:hypothetical protein
VCFQTSLDVWLESISSHLYNSFNHSWLQNNLLSTSVYNPIFWLKLAQLWPL